MLGVAKRGDPRVGGESLIGGLGDDEVVEIGTEKAGSSFTHRVVFWRCKVYFLVVKRERLRAGFWILQVAGQ